MDHPSYFGVYSQHSSSSSSSQSQMTSSSSSSSSSSFPGQEMYGQQGDGYGRIPQMFQPMYFANNGNGYLPSPQTPSNIAVMNSSNGSNKPVQNGGDPFQGKFLAPLPPLFDPPQMNYFGVNGVPSNSNSNNNLNPANYGYSNSSNSASSNTHMFANAFDSSMAALSMNDANAGTLSAMTSPKNDLFNNVGNQRKRFFTQMEDLVPFPFTGDGDEAEERDMYFSSRGILEESDSFLELLPGYADNGTTSVQSSLLDDARPQLFNNTTSSYKEEQIRAMASTSIPAPTFAEPNWAPLLSPLPLGGVESSSSSNTLTTMPEPISNSSLDTKPSATKAPRKKKSSTDVLPTAAELSERVKSVSEEAFKSFVVKKWTDEEDELLRRAVELNVSKNWRAIAKCVPGRNEQQCIQRWKNVLACNFKKGTWSEEEDQMLAAIIKAHAQTAAEGDQEGWDKEAARILNRTPKQCRERWENAMNPHLCNKEFTKEEDEAILSLHAKLGNQWKKIAAYLNGRTGNRVKSRFQSLHKKTKTSHDSSSYYGETSEPSLTI